MPTYSELLRDPRWQKKRLHILERDNWKCYGCEAETKPLHVHHKRYHGKPWDSPDHFLITLCEDCHKSETACLKIAPEYLAKAAIDKCFGSLFFYEIAEALKSIDEIKCPDKRKDLLERIVAEIKK